LVFNLRAASRIYGQPVIYRQSPLDHSMTVSFLIGSKRSTKLAAYPAVQELRWWTVTRKGLNYSNENPSHNDTGCSILMDEYLQIAPRFSFAPNWWRSSGCHVPDPWRDHCVKILLISRFYSSTYDKAGNVPTIWSCDDTRNSIPTFFWRLGMSRAHKFGAVGRLSTFSMDSFLLLMEFTPTQVCPRLNLRGG